MPPNVYDWREDAKQIARISRIQRAIFWLMMLGFLTEACTHVVTRRLQGSGIFTIALVLIAMAAFTLPVTIAFEQGIRRALCRIASAQAPESTGELLAGYPRLLPWDSLPVRISLLALLPQLDSDALLELRKNKRDIDAALLMADEELSSAIKQYLLPNESDAIGGAHQ